MKENLHFEISTYILGESAFRIPEDDNYDYWVPLSKYYFEKSDNVEIHCWNEELNVIEETKTISNVLEISCENGLTYLKGPLTLEIMNYILYNAVNKKGEFKWFSIFLRKGSDTIFHSEHWATEFFVPDVTEKDTAYIHTVTPTNTNFNQYQE